MISPALRSRLYGQEALRVYLDSDQVLSWLDTPSQAQAAKLAELADLPSNPRNPLNQACSIL